MVEPLAGTRCAWADGDPLLGAYHDHEWGVPLHDDRALFELLTLEGAQAGLSWLTVLRRRDGYRRAFAEFDLRSVAGFGEADLRRLLADPGIIRNRHKLRATVANAQGVLDVQREHGSFDSFVWSFVGHQALAPERANRTDIPARTAESAALSSALRKRGFGFVGPTICYAFMQAAGLANDHVATCPRRAEIG